MMICYEWRFSVCVIIIHDSWQQAEKIRKNKRKLRMLTLGQLQEIIKKLFNYGEFKYHPMGK